MIMQYAMDTFCMLDILQKSLMFTCGCASVTVNALMPYILGIVSCFKINFNSGL